MIIINFKIKQIFQIYNIIVNLKLKQVFQIYNKQPTFLKILELVILIITSPFLLDFISYDESYNLAIEEEKSQTIPVWVKQSGPYDKKTFDDGSSITFDLGKTELLHLPTKDGINAIPPEGLEFDSMTAVHGPYIEFDQKQYSPKDRVYATIFDFWNEDSSKKDFLGSFNDRTVTISTTSNSLDYIAEETREDTGIFSLEIQLTGISEFDVNGDGSYDMEGITYGQGPRNGMIASSNDDEITVSYEVSPGNFVTASAPISMYLGEVFIYPKEGKQNSFVVYLEDYDLNFDFETQEKAYVTLISDSNPRGIELELVETDWQGRFKGEFDISSDESKNNINANIGDKVSVIYYDKTLPAPYSIGNVEEISDSIFYEPRIDIVNK